MIKLISKSLSKGILFSLLILCVNQPMISQNWLPLKLGNKWQFMNEITRYYPQFNDLTYNYSLIEFEVIRDSIINEEKYYLCNQIWYKYNIDEMKLYRWQGGSDILVMDFSKSVGETFISGGYVYTVIGGTNILFSDSIEYKGSRSAYNVPPNYTYTVNEARYTSDIGWFYFLYSGENPNIRYYDKKSLLMAIQYDSLGGTNYLTNHYKPNISLTPILNTNQRQFRLDLNVEHYYNETPSQYTGGFTFIDSVFMESYYSKDDSIVTVPPKYKPGSLNIFYNFTFNLDTLIMQNGFVFNYRITSKDKGIIPETSTLPDTGYYKCVWDFSTDIDDNELQHVKEFSLSQNYPNPFNPSTKISWQSPVGSHQTLKVYDVLGREVATLFNEYRDAGSYEVEFNAKNLSSGVYYYQLKVGEYVETRKMILIK